MVKIDLKDACFVVPINTQDKKHKVHVERRSVSVQLPTFWAVMCSLGLYQDNQAESETLLRDHIGGILYLLENLGFLINFPSPYWNREGS